MTWAELEQLPDFNLVETNWSALLEQSKEDQLDAVALGELFEVPIKPDEIFRSKTIPCPPLIPHLLPPFHRKITKPSNLLRLFIALVYYDDTQPQPRLYDEVQEKTILC